MFLTVKYFIKTSVIFLIIGIIIGLYMAILKYILKQGYTQELISAHTHLILLGSLMMMVMGIVLWFFPRAEEDDKKYNCDLILFTYWLMTIITSFCFIFQVIANFVYADSIHFLIDGSSFIQVFGIILFFFSMWGMIEPSGATFVKLKVKNSKNKRRLYV